MAVRNRSGAPAVLEALSVLRVTAGAWWTHQLRHFAGTSWYQATGDLLLTAKLLRHANVRTTQTYAQIADGRDTQVINSMRCQEQYRLLCHCDWPGGTRAETRSL